MKTQDIFQVSRKQQKRVEQGWYAPDPGPWARGVPSQSMVLILYGNSEHVACTYDGK